MEDIGIALDSWVSGLRSHLLRKGTVEFGEEDEFRLGQVQSARSISKRKRLLGSSYGWKSQERSLGV